MLYEVITCAQLADNLSDPTWVVVDCRHQLSDVGYGERDRITSYNVCYTKLLRVFLDPVGEFEQ